MAAKIRQIRGKWYVVIHYKGHRWKECVGTSQRAAQEVADTIQAEIKLGKYEEGRPAKVEPVPFAEFADEWHRREILLPIERGHEGSASLGTAEVYALQIRVHLTPFFRDQDVQTLTRAHVQAFYDHCVETGRPRSAKSIDMALNALRQILSYARSRGLVATNAVEEWRRDRKRRRRSSSFRIEAARVMSGTDLARVLETAAVRNPYYFPLILFLADTGCRFGEAAALRWLDVDLEGGTARIARSYSSGLRLGPTKTGRERVVELSSRLRSVLRARQPDLLSDDALVFPNRSGGFLLDGYFRNKVFYPLIKEALGEGRHHRPHDLRHTWASLHLSRGTPIKWIQAQGGWTTAKVLLDTYADYMPEETRGFADRLFTAENAPPAHPQRSAVLAGSDGNAELPDVPADSDDPDDATGPRSPIMHFTLPPPFFRNSLTSTTTGSTPRSRTCARSRSETPAGMTRCDESPCVSVKELAA
jgi:integrase